MGQRAFLFALWGAMTVLCSSGCATLRKLSHVESRAPAGATAETPISPLRDQMEKLSTFARACPREIAEVLPGLAAEKVKFPPCPERLISTYAAAHDFLRIDERSTVDQLITSECHSLAKTGNDDSFDSLVSGIDPSAKRGGREGDPSPAVWTESELRLRSALRESLLEMRNLNEPLEQWIRLNGEFAIPEEQLGFFQDLVVKKSCSLDTDEVDQSYRTLHSLEELLRIQPESDQQRARVEHLLRGAHKIIDRKIREFFRP